MNQRILNIIFFLLLGVISLPLAAEEENTDDFGLQAGDFGLSVGAGKNIFFNEEFELVAPYMIPVALNFAVANKVELTAEYMPVFFADRSNVNFENTNALKNHNFGSIQGFGGEVKYAVYNDYGVMAFLSGGGKYNILNKNQYRDDQLQELDGTGYNLTAGLGVRYHLGDEHGDVFPWYFEMGIYYNRIKYEISNYKLDGEVQPTTDSHWNDLNLNGLDVAIRFGYRFRNK